MARAEWIHSHRKPQSSSPQLDLSGGSSAQSTLVLKIWPCGHTIARVHASVIFVVNLRLMVRNTTRCQANLNEPVSLPEHKHRLCHHLYEYQERQP